MCSDAQQGPEKSTGSPRARVELWWFVNHPTWDSTKSSRLARLKNKGEERKKWKEKNS